VWISYLSLEKTLKVIDSRKEFGQRMDFDIEILVRSLWDNLHIVQLPVGVKYPIDGVSHFQLFNDNFLITKLHIRLFFGMIFNSPKLLFRKVFA